MSKDAYTLDLSLGFKRFDVKFAEFGESVSIYFNPSDADLPKRWVEAQKRIEDALDSLKISAVDDNGTPDTDEYVEKINEVNAVIYDSVDYAFGNKISDKIFSHCSPLASTNGQPFIAQFLEKIAPVMQKVIERESRAVSAAAQKYLQKYKK